MLTVEVFIQSSSSQHRSAWTVMYREACPSELVLRQVNTRDFYHSCSSMNQKGGLGMHGKLLL